VFKSARQACQQVHFKPAMSNPNDLLSKTLRHYLNQSHIMSGIVVWPAYWMAYVDLSKL